eukprot:959247_1
MAASKGSTGWLGSLWNYMGITYSLSGLQNDIENLKTDDPKPIMKYVQKIEKFRSPDKPQAMQALCNLFWKRQNNDTYRFTSRIRYLTADELSMVICNVGDEHINKYIFTGCYDPILSSYPRKDLIPLLKKHNSDNFANYLLNQGDAYSNWPFEERTYFLEYISIDVMLSVYNEYNKQNKLHPRELLICFRKMMRSKNVNKCLRIFPAVITAICAQDMKVLSLDELYFIYTNDLFPVDMNIKLFIDELKRRHPITVAKLNKNKHSIDTERTGLNRYRKSIRENVKNYNSNSDRKELEKIPSVLDDLSRSTDSLNLRYEWLISANRTQVLNETLQTALTFKQRNVHRIRSLEADDDAKQQAEISRLKDDNQKLEEQDVIITQLNEETERVKLGISGIQKEFTDLSHKCAQDSERMAALIDQNNKLMDDQKEHELVIQQLKNANNILKRKSIHAIPYEQWDTEDVVLWIMSLDNGRFEKYKQKLQENLTTEGVLGHDLKMVDSGDIRGWGVTDFRDKKYLLQQIQELVIKNENEKDDEGAVNDYNDAQGPQTAYK